MAYDDYDLTPDSGEAIEIYEFATATKVWRHTTYNQNVTSTNLFTPLELTRAKVEHSSNLLKQSLRISFPKDSDLAAAHLQNSVDEIMSLNVWTLHADEPDSKLFVFKGRAVSIEIEDSKVVVIFEPVNTTMRRLGFQLKYQRICRHTLYGSMCGANTANHFATGIVTSINKSIITLDEVGSVLDENEEEIGFADKHFTAGYIVTDSGFKRMVINHVGINLTLIRPLHNLSVGDTVTVYAGCDHSFSTCRDKFDNDENYGGFDFIPYTNPFKGTQIF